MCLLPTESPHAVVNLSPSLQLLLLAVAVAVDVLLPAPAAGDDVDDFFELR
jgi:hypothetical protein